MEKLTDLNFNFDTDLLIGVGDLVDRGPYSFKCLNLVHEKWFKTVKGNHEDFIEWKFEDSSDLSSLHISNGGSWFYQLSIEDQYACYSIVKSLPYVITLTIGTETIAVLHAELPLKFKDWSDLSINLNRPSFKETLLWGRSKIERGDVSIIENIDKIYCGHTVVKNPINLGNCYYIDTGAYHYGNITICKLK